ncbi:MAG TPA: VOC family protein [Gemmatimonadaceae bacterium]
MGDFPSPVPEIPVSNLDTALEYYRDQLGFSVDWHEREIALAGVSRGECRLFLSGASFRKGQGSFSPVVIWLNLNSRAEVDALHREWHSRQAIVMSEPESKSFGLHEFTAADRDGNRFRVFYDFGTPQRQEM